MENSFLWPYDHGMFTRYSIGKLVFYDHQMRKCLQGGNKITGRYVLCCKLQGGKKILVRYSKLLFIRYFLSTLYNINTLDRYFLSTLYVYQGQHFTKGQNDLILTYFENLYGKFLSEVSNQFIIYKSLLCEGSRQRQKKICKTKQ